MNVYVLVWGGGKGGRRVYKRTKYVCRLLLVDTDFEFLFSVDFYC